MSYAFDYPFVRNLITTADGTTSWDTDHPDRKDLITGKQIHIAKEIEAAFPNWSFVCMGDNGTLHVCSNEACPDPVLLNQVVEDHQNNV